MVVMIPNLYRLFVFKYLSTFSSTVVEIITPMTINIAQIIKAGKGLYIFPKRDDDSGINEIKEIVSIIPLEKANDLAIMELCLFVLIKQGIMPIMVEKPAMAVIKKLCNVVFMVKFMQ